MISSSDQSKIGSNVLTDLVGDLRGEGILQSFGPKPAYLQQRAGEIYEPGMKKSNMFLPYEDPQNIFETGANLSTQFNPFLNITSGIFGSSAGMRGDYYGREVLGLEGDELNNFAASVANDRNLYNQMMATPKMQEYELNEFRAEANKNAMARMRGGDPDPISGSQGGEGGEGGEGDGTTDPGTDPVYTPPPQNYYTFFDPDMGKYRSGTYDEYLRYVTAKDGGIIQLENGGMTPNSPGGSPITVNDVDAKSKIADLYNAREEIMGLVPQFQSEVEGKEMMVKDIDAKIDLLLNNPANERRDSAVKMAEEDQPLRDLFGRAKESLDGIFQNLKGRRDLAEDPVTTASMIVLDNRDGKLKVVPRNRETLEMLRNGTYSQTNRDATESGVMVSPSPIGGRRPVNPDTNDQIDDMMRDQFMNRLYDQALEFQNQKEQDGGTTVRDPRTNEVMGYNVADGGIIGLKEGGMNDMMEANSLMFKDPSDEGEWEYNV